MRNTNIHARLNIGKIEMTVNEDGDDYISEIELHEDDATIVSEDRIEKFVMAELEKNPHILELFDKMLLEEEIEQKRQKNNKLC